MKVGDLVRHAGGDGDTPAIGIVVRKHPQHNYWEVLELCGQYVGCKSEADDPTGSGWIIISEISLTDHDRRDTLQG